MKLSKATLTPIFSLIPKYIKMC